MLFGRTGQRRCREGELLWWSWWIGGGGERSARCSSRLSLESAGRVLVGAGRAHEEKRESGAEPERATESVGGGGSMQAGVDYVRVSEGEGEGEYG